MDTTTTAPTADYNNVRSAIQALRGRFFRVKFVKADGTIRTMVCRTGVSKFLKGTEAPDDAAARRERDEAQGVIRVWECGNGYRSFRIDSIIELKLQGVTYSFSPVIPEPVVEFNMEARTATIRCGESAWTASPLKNGTVKIPAAAERVIGERVAAEIRARLSATVAKAA